MEKLSNNKFIVIGSDHYNPLGVCRSLGEIGIEPIYVMWGNLHPHMISHCKYVKILHKVKNPQDIVDFLINQYGSEEYKPFIITCDDIIAELLDNNYDKLIEKFYFFNGGGQGNLTYYMNKENICNLAEDCGIQKPKGEVLKRGELPRELRYPVITKVTRSVLGGWKDDVYICNDESELIEAYKHIKADVLLVQEYIVKKNELCLDGFSINGGAEVLFAYTSEYIRFSKNGYGNYMWMKPYNNQEVKNQIQNILKRSKFSGIFSVECLIDKDDKLYFLEVNFRNSTWSYAYTYAGINLPYEWASATLSGHINIDVNKVMKKPFTAMMELADFSMATHQGIPLKQWFREWKSCDCYYLANKRDPWPFRYALIYRIKTKINHLLHKKK